MSEYKLFTYELSSYNHKDEIENWQGIIFAESYSDAMNKFETFYGDNDIIKVNIKEWYNESEDSFIELSKSTIQTMIEKGDLKE